MTNNYIDNQLVKLLYNETSVSEELALKQNMAENSSLKRSYEDMKRIKEKLDHSLQKPSSTSIQKIMDYSKKQKREASI